MSFKQIQKITTSNADINKLQDNIASSVNPILKKAQLDSQIIAGVTLSAGQVNNVPHLLNRVPLIFKHAAYSQCFVWYAQASDSLFLYLMCSADVTIDIEVS